CAAGGEAGGAGGPRLVRKELLPAERPEDVAREVEGAGGADEAHVRPVERPRGSRQMLREQDAGADGERSEDEAADEAAARGIHPLPIGRAARPTDPPAGLGPAVRLLQVLVHESDRHAALADRGGDPLDRAVADVAAGEDAGAARLEQLRVAVELPLPGGGDVGAGEDIAALVEGDLGRQPRRLGVGTDED